MTIISQGANYKNLLVRGDLGDDTVPKVKKKWRVVRETNYKRCRVKISLE